MGVCAGGLKTSQRMHSGKKGTKTVLLGKGCQVVVLEQILRSRKLKICFEAIAPKNGYGANFPSLLPWNKICSQ